MFYHPVLLSPQHQMGLFVPWLAATRGIKFVTKEKIVSANLVKLCKHLLRFIESESHDPNKRFSLRLAVMLVHGTILVFNAQVKELQDRVTNFAMQRLADYIKILQNLTPPTSGGKKQGESKKKKVHTPSSWDNSTNAEKNIDSTTVQARVEDITLREEPPKSKDQPQSHFDDFEELSPMDIDANKENVPEVNPNLIVTEVEVHQEERDTAHINVTEPPPVLSVAVPELPPEEEIQYVIQPLEIEPVLASTAPAEQVMDEIAPQVSVQEPAKEPQEAVGEKEIDKQGQFAVPQQAPPKARLPKGIFNKLFYIENLGRRRRNIISKHQTALNDAGILSDVARLALLLPDFEKIPEEFTFGLPDMEQILQEFSIDKARHDDEPIEARKGSTLQSGSLFQSAEFRTPSLRSEDTPLTPKKRRQTQEKTISENIPPAAHGASLETPTKRKRIEPRLISVEIPTSSVRIPFSHVQDIMDQQSCSIKEKLPEAAIMQEILQISQPQQITIEEMPQEPIQQTVAPESASDEGQLFGMTWASRIHNLLQIKNKLTPLEICRQLFEPVTRPHMARIFAGLLVLCKEKVVRLHPAKNSLELEFAEFKIE